MCLDNSSLCCSCAFLHFRCLCCTRNCLQTMPELHLDLSSLQSPVLHLDGFPLQGTELNMVLSGQVACMCCSWTYLYTLQRPVHIYSLGPDLHLEGSTLQIPALPLDVFRLQGPYLHLDMSTLLSPVLHQTCLLYRGLSCIRMCLQFRC
jgi:hypothetical protein